MRLDWWTHSTLSRRRRDNKCADGSQPPVGTGSTRNQPCEFVLLDDDRSEDSGCPGNCGNSEGRKMLELDRDCTGKSVDTRGGALTADARSTVIKGVSIAARSRISG